MAAVKKTSAKKSPAKNPKANAKPKKAANTTKSTVKKVAKKATASTKKAANGFANGFDSVIAGSPMNNYFGSMEEMMTKTPFQFDKLTQDASEMGQAQMEAAVKSSTLFFKGMEDIMKTCIELAQDSGEKASEAAKQLMSCKTLNELTEAQTKVAQKSFDDFMAGATKLSEMSVKVCTEACEPLNNQMGKTIKKASDTMAA